MKDKKACIFYFLMTLILLDFGNQLRKISFNSYIENIDNPIFSIFHVNNTGGAFSLFQNNYKILAVLAILIVFFVFVYVFKNISFNDKTELLSLTLFSAGALGNALERFNNGFVVDYIKLTFINFPVFNAFDIMICVGIFLYFCLFLSELKRAKNG